VSQPLFKLAGRLDDIHKANDSGWKNGKSTESNVGHAQAASENGRQAYSDGRLRSSLRTQLLLIKRGVLFDELSFVVGHFLERINRVGGADRDTCATVNAALRVDIHLSRGLELRLLFFGMNAVGRANVGAKRIFDASIGNYISHDESISRDGMSTSGTAQERV
jgi:hypothetical protein